MFQSVLLKNAFLILLPSFNLGFILHVIFPVNVSLLKSSVVFIQQKKCNFQEPFF